ncbi:hypothetical protein JCM5296_004243 [Sporobolomyces johnsonii]
MYCSPPPSSTIPPLRHRLRHLGHQHWHNSGTVLQQDEQVSIDRNTKFDLAKYAKTLRPSDLCPVAYELRRPALMEQHFLAQECELLAIVHSLKHWRGYVKGSPILVHSDHKTLKYFCSQCHLTADMLSRRGGLPEATDDATPLLANTLTDSASLEHQTMDKVVSSRSQPPLEAAQDLTKKTHVNLGHLASRSVARTVANRYWFPQLTAIVEDTLSTCTVCQFLDHSQPGPQPLHLLPPVEAFRLWSLDFVGPLTRSKRGNEYLITTIDHGTGWPFASSIAGANDQATLTMFIGHRFTAALNRLGIKHFCTTLHHPQTNGRVERFHKMFVDTIVKLRTPDCQDEWDEHISDALLVTVRQAILELPTDTEIQEYQHKASTQIHDLEPLRREAANRAFEIRDCRAIERDGTYAEQGIVISDQVLRFNDRCQSRLQPRWDGPFILCALAPNGTIQLETPSGHILCTLNNIMKLKKYHPGAEMTELWPSLKPRSTDGWLPSENSTSSNCRPSDNVLSMS